MHAARVLQDVFAVLQHPVAQSKLTALGVHRIRDVSCFPQLCQLRVLQVKGMHLRVEDLLLMQRLSCLTSLTVERLAGAHAGQRGLQCSDLPPQLQLLCVRDLHLWNLHGWMNVLPAVSTVTSSKVCASSSLNMLRLALWLLGGGMQVGKWPLLCPRHGLKLCTCVPSGNVQQMRRSLIPGAVHEAALCIPGCRLLSRSSV
jgi:hypothetical protein